VSEPTVVVGEIAKVHGLRGELLVKVHSEVPDRFAPGATVFDDTGRRLTIRSTRDDRGRLLVTFEGVSDRAAAERLRGLTLVVPESWLPDLPEGRWWPHQLVGCRVVTEAGVELGTLAEVVDNPANDIWVVVDDASPGILVPAIREVIVHVDPEERLIVVRDIVGLTVPEDPGPEDPGNG
jgi:16S rRNA processing protein RimM